MPMRFAFDRRPDDDGDSDDRRDREYAHNDSVFDDGYARSIEAARTEPEDDHLWSALKTLARIDGQRDAEAGVNNASASWQRRGAPHGHAARYRAAFIREYETANKGE